MAFITLRSYITVIKEALAAGKISEAIAHCRYILQTYPKLLDIYRLYGEALLELRQFLPAADAFQRLLSAIPDDFVGHVGMSVIQEDNPDLPYHAVSEFWFDDNDARVQAFTTLEGKAAAEDATAHCASRVHLLTDEKIIIE